MLLRWNLLLTGARASSAAGDFGSHKYWRFQADAMNSDTYVAWREIRMYDASNVQITTTGQTYSEGGAGVQGAHGASAPFDGNTGTYWARSGAPSWVQIQFSSNKAPARFEFECESVARGVVSFTVLYSDDGSSWTTAFSGWEPSWDAVGAFRSWPQAVVGQYKAYGWRVTANNGDSFVIMNEAELHAVISGADIATGGAAWSSTNTGTGTVPASLFDDNTATHFDWTSAQLPGYIYYAFPTYTAIPAEFNLTQNNTTARAWKDFTFFGTNDGVTFDTLKTLTNQTWTTTPETKTYTV